MKKAVWGAIIALSLLIGGLSVVTPGQMRIDGTVAGLAAGPGGTVTATGPFLAPDGASNAPGYSFSAQPGFGFYRTGPSHLALNGYLALINDIDAANVNVGGTGYVYWGGRSTIRAPFNGGFAIATSTDSVGSVIKADALPTVASGFGTSPAVTAGSTAFGGSVNVGTGGAATTGTITFNGTAFPGTPFCVYSTQTTNAVTRGVPTTTTLALSSTTAWTASDIVTWHCVSAR